MKQNKNSEKTELLVKYRGYFGLVSPDISEGYYHGKIINIPDLVAFDGKTIKDLKISFEDVVNDYIETCKLFNKPIVSEDTVCISCGVPKSQHSTCCGWENANTIFFPWEHSVNARISSEEKELRYLISQSPNGLKMSRFLNLSSPNKIPL